MSTTDLATADGARAWLDHLKAVIAEGFATQGSVPPLALFVVTRDDSTGRLLPQPREVMSMLANDLFAPDGDGKDKVALWMMRFARVHHAIAYAFVSEA